MKRSVTRRQMIIGGTLTAMTAGSVSGLAAPSSMPSQPSLLVAGPTGSRADRWADLIAAPLGQVLLGGGTLSWENVGGADGVTGVNQYHARTNPDGATALLLPGAPLLAWLVGDTRVRFDAGAWAPLWGGTTVAVVLTRAPLVIGRIMRVGVQSVTGPELEALLALELMGIEAVPVAVGADAAQRPDIDALYVRGAATREQSSALASQGWRPAFSLSSPPGNQPVRDPAFPNLPQARELFSPARAEDANLSAAFRAVAAAASLEVALVMPAVAPAAVLAWWRRGCNQLDDANRVRDAATATMMQQDDAGQIATQLSSIALDPPAMLSLRTLLAERYHWRPS